MALAVLLVAALWPAYAAYLDQRAIPAMPGLAVEAGPGWRQEAAFTDWIPHWTGADRQFRSGFAQGSQRVLLEVNYYATQRQDAELINSQNFMIRQKHPVWSNVGESQTTVDVAGQPRQVRQAKLKSTSGQRLLVWQWNVIDGRHSVSDYYAKLVLATDRLRLSRDDGASVLIAAPYEESPAQAAKVLARFIQDNEAAIERAIRQVSGK